MGLRGAIDIWGNDHYLWHIHRAMRFFVRPTHTVILGDHMSSQWISDEEFHRRADRMEKKVLKWPEGHEVFNVTGNHDIGYAGDMTIERLGRWHERFGAHNFIHAIDHETLSPGSTAIRVVVLNDLLLDGPAYEERLRNDTHEFLNQIPKDGVTTILLTHVPLFKYAGICRDPPYMAYDAATSVLKEQNHLSHESSRKLLHHLYDDGEGIIVNGHDHEGCLAQHRQLPGGDWLPSGTQQKGSHATDRIDAKIVEEVTVRSVMGQYGGNSGLLTGAYSTARKKWHFQYTAVPFVHNTLWWMSHIVTGLVLFFLAARMALRRTVVGRQVRSSLVNMLLRRTRSRKMRTL